MYNKLFTRILDSSIWLEPITTRIVWITLLAAMDEDGYAHFSAIENLAARARVTVTECQEAVTALLSPDPNSADPDFEGRRIERVPGGFMILNALKYRNNFNNATRREQTRLRVQKHRAKKAGLAISKDNNQCVYCGETATGPDHVVPVSAGGADDDSNCVLSCTRCNRHKASQELVNFLNDKGLPFSFDVQSIVTNPVLGKLVRFNGNAFVPCCNAKSQNVTHPYEYASESPSASKEEGSGKGEFELESEPRPKISKRKGPVEDVIAYAREKGLEEDDGRWFFDKCEGCGWKNKGEPIIDWMATMRSWKKQGYFPSQKPEIRNGKQVMKPDYSKGF